MRIVALVAGLTPYQEALLAATAPQAQVASQQAEGQLLEQFETLAFRAELQGLALGDGYPMTAPVDGTQLLRKVQRALAVLEYTTNLGLSPAEIAKNPTLSSPNVSTIEQFGHYPNEWQLKLANSSIKANVSETQWRVYDGAETRLYGLEEFATPLQPTQAEALGRPVYAAGNLRRLDTAVELYGAYAMVYRGSVVRDRMLVIPTDSGAWQDACNASIPGQKSWLWPLEKRMYACDGMGGSWQQAAFRPTPARVGAELHTLFGNAETFKHIGGKLARLVHQLTSANTHAKVEPVEFIWYTEGAVLGTVTMGDLKVMVASFQSLLGTEVGDALQAFCVRHSLPLAWGFGPGDKKEWYNRLPVPMSGPAVPVGRSRLVDPATAGFTNAHVDAAKWAVVEQKLRLARQSAKSGVSAKDLASLWAELVSGQPAVEPLSADGPDCDTDLCFGAVGEACVCRSRPQEAVLV